MCILFFMANPNPSPNGYKLILVNNRDEYYNRPTKVANFWESNPDILGGVDMEKGKEGGTWLAMSRQGRIGLLLNILQPVGTSDSTMKGRGFLVPDFLIGSKDGPTYLKQVKKENHLYNSFNIVTMEFKKSDYEIVLAHHSNLSSDEPTILSPGIHGFGNSLPETPWKKVEMGKALFSEIIAKHPSTETIDELENELLSLLRNKTCCWPDPQLFLQGEGRDEDFLKSLSSLYIDIRSIKYGTRTNSIIFIDANDKVKFIERTVTEPIKIDDPHWTKSIYKFDIVSDC